MVMMMLTPPVVDSAPFSDSYVAAVHVAAALFLPSVRLLFDSVSDVVLKPEVLSFFFSSLFGRFIPPFSSYL